MPPYKYKGTGHCKRLAHAHIQTSAHRHQLLSTFFDDFFFSYLSGAPRGSGLIGMQISSKSRYVASDYVDLSVVRSTYLLVIRRSDLFLFDEDGIGREEAVRPGPASGGVSLTCPVSSSRPIPDLSSGSDLIVRVTVAATVVFPRPGRFGRAGSV